MKKRYALFLSLCLPLFLFLAACGGDDEEAASDVLQVYGDVVSEGNGCVLQSQFQAGDKMVFRVNAIDPTSNEQVSEDAQLTVHLSNGEDLEMRHMPHPSGDREPVPEFWTAVYEVTEDTPTGIIEYSVTAEYEDKTGEFSPFDVEPSLLTVVDGTSTEEAEG